MFSSEKIQSAIDNFEKYFKKEEEKKENEELDINKKIIQKDEDFENIFNYLNKNESIKILKLNGNYSYHKLII
jgi:hypothetical protein